jgi:hypothetical protein
MMATEGQDALLRAYSRIRSLRQNLPDWVSEKYVREYHDVLVALESLGIDVEEFRIPPSDVAPKVASVSYPDGSKTYTDEKYVEKQLMLTKLDAILGYFELMSADRPKQIGFRTPDKA